MALETDDKASKAPSLEFMGSGSQYLIANMKFARQDLYI